MDEDLTVLTMLREEFPAYRIWREVTPGRLRYVACSRYWGLNPHTVVTPDPAELRQALDASPSAGKTSPALFSAVAPNVARLYDYLLNGKDHYATDRSAADSILTQFPEVAAVARANRAFLGRAIRHVAQEGISQFIDIGCGLPASPNVHEVVHEVNPDARVAYVDRDPVVLAHARALLADSDTVTVVSGDLRDPAALLAGLTLTGAIDQAQPVCVLLTSVLHFLTTTDADTVVAAIRKWMAPGSYLVISAGTSTGTDPELIQRLQAAYRDTAPITGRTASEIGAWFDGLALEDPGLVDVWAWRPDHTARPLSARVRFLAGVGRKPMGTSA